MTGTSIQSNIKQARESSGLTQSELAYEMNISHQAYYNIERGKTAAINPNIEKMAKATGLPEEVILFGKKDNELSGDYKMIISTLKEAYEAEIESLKAVIKLHEELRMKNEKLIATLTSYNRVLLEQLAMTKRAEIEASAPKESDATSEVGRPESTDRNNPLEEGYSNTEE